MAQTIKLKRSATSGAVPAAGSLELGEVAINTHDGKVYIKKNDGAESVVEVGADQTPAELLTAIKTVDGSGSGLDADLLDGLELHTGRNNVANRVVRTDGSGYIQAGWINTTSGQTSNPIAKIYGSYAGDNYLRWFAPSTIISQQGIWTSSNDGSGSGLDADLLDGQQGSYYLNTSTKLFKSGAEIAGSQDLNTYRVTGYYSQDSNADATSGSNYPVLAAGILEVITGDQGNNLQTEQRYSQYNNNDKYVRHYYNGNWTAWAKQWNSANDGAGSGLDADLLDGQQGSYYYPASNPNGYTNDQTAAEILTAIKTVDGSGSGLDADTVDGHHAYESQILDTRDSGDVTPNGFGDKRVSYSFTDEIAGSTHTWDSVITVKGWSDTYRAWQITSNSSSDDTDQNLYFRSGRNDTWGSLRTVWDSGNDGPGSGLNADLLDGVQGSGYVNTTGTQSIGGGKSFGNILTVDGSQTGGYPLQRLTSSSVSTYGRIEFGYTGQVSRGKLQYNNTGDSMAFWTATAERARITSAGDILVNKTGSNPSVVGNELKASGNIYATQDYPALSSQLLLRNNSSTDSLLGFGCYNGLSGISTTSSTGGGHSLYISGGMSGEYARFTNDKRLGIGTTAPVERLHVIGNIVATGNITAFYSDERLKDLKGTIPNALDKVNQLNGYYYTPNETAQALGVDNKGLEVGISAQEVEAVLPEIVTKSAIGDDYKTVWYEKLTPLLIEAVKELTEKVDKLEARLTELEK